VHVTHTHQPSEPVEERPEDDDLDRDLQRGWSGSSVFPAVAIRYPPAPRKLTRSEMSAAQTSGFAKIFMIAR
jgi:hypothetical protein